MKESDPKTNIQAKGMQLMKRAEENAETIRIHIIWETQGITVPILKKWIKLEEKGKRPGESNVG